MMSTLDIIAIICVAGIWLLLIAGVIGLTVGGRRHVAPPPVAPMPSWVRIEAPSTKSAEELERFMGLAEDAAKRYEKDGS